jgi:predicted peroxiredoxin
MQHREERMKFLIHVTCGVENPSKAALAFLVAKSAITAGHEVSMFLAGDGVQLVRPAVVDNLVGLGSGALKDHMAAIVAGGGRFYVSGLSAKTRGLDTNELSSASVEAAMPDVLVRLAAGADRVLCY